MVMMMRGRKKKKICKCIMFFLYLFNTAWPAFHRDYNHAAKAIAECVGSGQG
jgi:hypothetical protein